VEKQADGSNRRHRPDFWAGASRLVGLLAKLASLAEAVHKLLR
jgi:hypothetical protein